MNYCGDESLIRECVRSGSSFSTLHNEVVFLDTTCPKYEHWVYINTCINEPVIRLKLANMASTLKAKVSESGCPCVGSLMCAALNNNKSTQHAKSRKHNTKKPNSNNIVSIYLRLNSGKSDFAIDDNGAPTIFFGHLATKDTKEITNIYSALSASEKK